MMRSLAILPIFALLLVLAVGCTPPELNPTPPLNEESILSDALEITHGFQRAGEAYFSPDMKWIIFQASMKPDEDYQMYVAQLKWSTQDGVPPLSVSPGSSRRYDGASLIIGTHTPVRISPIPSWNSCGYFSPDGDTIAFQAVPNGKKHYQIYTMRLDEGFPVMVSTGRGACTSSSLEGAERQCNKIGTVTGIFLAGSSPLDNQTQPHTVNVHIK